MRTGEGEGGGDEARDGRSEGPTYPHWVQNRLIINLWQQCIEGDREFKTKEIIGGGEMGIPVLPELSPN